MTAERVIYKYPFAHNPIIEIPWDSSSRVLHVAAQPASAEAPTIWIEQPYEWGPSTKFRHFDLRPTGLPYPPDVTSEFIGTAVCADGALVWHIFAETIEATS